MRSAKPKAKKAVSPAVAVVIIVVAVVVAVVIGFSALRPKGDPFTGHGMKGEVYNQREANAKAWKEEIAKAKREGRQPNMDMQPVLMEGKAETVGSLKAKGFKGPFNVPPLSAYE